MGTGTALEGPIIYPSWFSVRFTPFRRARPHTVPSLSAGASFSTISARARALSSKPSTGFNCQLESESWFYARTTHSIAESSSLSRRDSCAGGGYHHIHCLSARLSAYQRFWANALKPFRTRNEGLNLKDTCACVCARARTLTDRADSAFGRTVVALAEPQYGSSIKFTPRGIILAHYFCRFNGKFFFSKCRYMTQP